MCNTTDALIRIENLGKMYKLYRNQRDKVLDVFGLNFFKKHKYKEFWALRNIDLTIEKGERVGFIGHNGAGKSTLLKLITGNIKPTEGSVVVKGKIQALLEMGTGFHPDFTGIENIRASLAYQGLSQKEIKELEEEIIDFTELGEYIEQPVKTYSAGMYSRLAFATASAVKPELMIIDEILGAGDAYFNAKCVERMQNLTAASGATFLFVSHDLQSVQALCTRLIWLDHGVIRYDGEVLYGIKLYQQEVRKKEEQRLIVRDKKKQTQNLALLDSVNELYDCYLFKISHEKDIGAKCGKFYTIRLFADDEQVAQISVGAAMDNDAKGECFIIDDPGRTCWGRSSFDGNDYYREVDLSAGTDHIAPFQFMLSKEYADKTISVVVDADTEGNDDVVLEYYSGDGYIKCGFFANGFHSNVFHLEQDINDDEIKETADSKENETKADNKKEDLDSLSAGARITNVRLVGDSQEEKKVFAFSERIDRCCFDIAFDKERFSFYFIFFVYTDKGYLLFSTCQRLTLDKDVKSISVQYPFPNEKLGPGEYNISIAVYDELDVNDDSREQKFLAMLDRGCSFKIERPIQYALGIGSIVRTVKPIIVSENVRVIRCENLIEESASYF